jgi:hypothetical protein
VGFAGVPGGQTEDGHGQGVPETMGPRRLNAWKMRTCSLLAGGKHQNSDVIINRKAFSFIGTKLESSNGLYNIGWEAVQIWINSELVSKQVRRSRLSRSRVSNGSRLRGQFLVN